MGDLHDLLRRNCDVQQRNKRFLIDAALSGKPEQHVMESWRHHLSQRRQEQEEVLGLTTENLRRYWASKDRKGCDEQRLFKVPAGPEYDAVCAIFKAMPTLPRHYQYSQYGFPDEGWEQLSVIAVHRVENGYEEDGNARPGMQRIRGTIQRQQIAFQEGIHTCWAFHGPRDELALESIVNSEQIAFQPVLAGSNVGTLWGAGTYFARDAKYCHDHGFYVDNDDGSKKLILCLLTVGLPCAADHTQRGVLPFRQGNFRYQSSVDSLANPELYILPTPGAAYPAYVITYC